MTLNTKEIAALLRELAKDSVCRSMSVAGCGDPECSATRAFRMANELDQLEWAAFEVPSEALR